MMLRKITKLLLISLLATLFSFTDGFSFNTAIAANGLTDNSTHAAAANDPTDNSSYLPSPNTNFFGNNGYSNPQAFHYSNGLLQLDTEWSDLFGFVFDSKVIPKLNENNALAIETDVGEKEGRINITWGTRFGLHNLAKLTAERLSQNLSFNFASGPIAERIPQYAFGGEYEYALSNTGRFNDINLGGYYADASSKSLNSVDFSQAGSDSTDFRHIAGATSKGLNIGVDIKPWRTSAFGAKLNYDQVDYHPLYVLLNDTHEHSGNFGTTLSFEQLITPSIKFDASGSKREIYDEYDVSTSWLLPIFPCNHVEAIASVDHTISHTDIPNNTSYLLGVNFALEGDPNHCFMDYSFPSFANNDDIVNWTKTPAVHMAYVLAAADEAIQKAAAAAASPSISNVSPNTGSTAGGTSVTITGSTFTGATSVTFGGTAASSFTVNSDTSITATTPPHLHGTVDVSVTGPAGTATDPASFTFVAPVVLSVTPRLGTHAGGTHVVILGSGFTAATGATLGGAPLTSFNVIDDSTISGITSAHAAGTVDAVVTNAGDSGTLASAFVYF